MSVLFYNLWLSVAVTFCLSTGPAYPQPHVHVIGGDPQKEVSVVERVTFYADLLGLGSQISIVVSFDSDLPKGVAGYTLFQAYRNDSPIMQVYIKIEIAQSQSVQLLTLAHEMVHVKQFVKGELMHCGDNTYQWNGKLYEHIQHIPYLQRQWEREALREQYTLSKQYRRERAYQKTKANHPPVVAINAEQKP